MKKLILICGANGIGKSSACRALVNCLDKSAYIDSDWCRVMNPFAFTQETINVIKNNIVAMMINYFHCSTVENVIFPYGFHGPRRQIFDGILSELNKQGISFQLCPILFVCDEAENIARMHSDRRDTERIQRALNNTRELYSQYDYPEIDVTALSIAQAASAIMDILSTIYA